MKNYKAIESKPCDVCTPSNSFVKIVVSDTHGEEFAPGSEPLGPVDVAIHCGDLTEESKIEEV